MRSALLISIFLTLISFSSFAQSVDTIYFNLNWHESRPEKALYYRTTPVKEDSLYLIKDFYISGALQMEGYSLSLEEDIFQGQVKRYDEKGRLKERVQYHNGMIDGDFIQYDSTGEIIGHASYSENLPIEGTIVSYEGIFHSKRTYQKGIMNQQVVYDPSKGTLTKVIIKLIEHQGDSVYQSESFNHAGVFVGKGIYTKHHRLGNGVFAYREPKSDVLHLSYYTDGKPDSILKYYSNHALKSRTVSKEGGNVITFFDQSGHLLDSIVCKEEDPWNGVEYEFNGDTAFRQHTYKKGMLHGPFFDTYYLHGVKRVGQYDAGQINGKVNFYDEEGDFICSGTYKKGLQHAGDFISRTDRYLMFTYKEGELIQKKRYYTNRKQLTWLDYRDSLRLTYNQDGIIISRLVYKGNRKHSGKEYSFSADDQIIQIKEYRDGVLVKNEFFNQKGKLKRSISYQDSGDRTEIAYYPEGMKQSVSTVNANSKRTTKTVYFNREGNPIGELLEENYDKDGDKYFFEQGNVYRIERYRNDTLIYKKRYVSNERLLFEIDYYGDAFSYDPWGNVVAHGTYKKGEPYHGTFYKYQHRFVKEIFHMKDGKLHGKKTTFAQNSALKRRIAIKEEQYKEGKREGFLKEYDKNGNPIQIIPYKNDKEDGEATFYGPNGAVRGIYDKGTHMKGTFYEYAYGQISSIKTLNNGQPHGRWITFNYSGDTSRVAYWEHGFQKEQTNYLFGKVYHISFKNNMKYTGVVPGYKLLQHYQNGHLIRKEKYANERLDRLIESIDHERSKSMLTKTLYRVNGQKASEIQYRAGKRDGEAMYYEETGKLTAKGVFKNDLPVHGVHIFYSHQSFDEYLKLRIEGHKAMAMAFQQETDPLTFSLEISEDLSEEAWLESMESFLRNVESSCNYRFEIL